MRTKTSRSPSRTASPGHCGIGVLILLAAWGLRPDGRRGAAAASSLLYRTRFHDNRVGARPVDRA
ncbi:hypothetical protein GCM10010151_61190 [Actinoallomurus spadix]|uniref:Uncharacterized protein n=1 Tax=Actinoallomurus spadix TaxID=79912 RepID=A0ABP3H7U5_9ACTN